MVNAVQPPTAGSLVALQTPIAEDNLLKIPARYPPGVMGDPAAKAKVRKAAQDLAAAKAAAEPRTLRNRKVLETVSDNEAINNKRQKMTTPAATFTQATKPSPKESQTGSKATARLSTTATAAPKTTTQKKSTSAPPVMEKKHLIHLKLSRTEPTEEEKRLAAAQKSPVVVLKIHGHKVAELGKRVHGHDHHAHPPTAQAQQKKLPPLRLKNPDRAQVDTSKAGDKPASKVRTASIHQDNSGPVANNCLEQKLNYHPPMSVDAIGIGMLLDAAELVEGGTAKKSGQ